MTDPSIRFSLDVDLPGEDVKVMGFSQTLLIGPDTDKVLFESNVAVSFEIEVHSGDLHVDAKDERGTLGWACMQRGGRLAWQATHVSVRSNDGASYQFTLPDLGTLVSHKLGGLNGVQEKK